MNTMFSGTWSVPGHNPPQTIVFNSKTKVTRVGHIPGAPANVEVWNIVVKGRNHIQLKGSDFFLDEGTGRITQAGDGRSWTWVKVA